MSYYSKDVYLAQTAGSSQWDVTFSYADQSEVAVYVDGVYTSFTWVNTGRIQIDTPLTETSDIVIARTTDLANRKVDFENAAEITEADLDNANIQVFHAMQEAADEVQNTMTVGSDNTFDVGGKRLKNLAAPTDDADAATKAYVIDQAASNKTGAEQAEAGAVIAQGLAEQAEAGAVIAQGLAEAAQVAAEQAEVNTQAVEDNVNNTASAVSAIASSISRKNLLIGNFRINQRQVTGTVVLGAGEYGHDRFRAGSGGCTYTFSTTDNVTTVVISAGTLEQEVEGVNILPGSYTLSWQGTTQGRIDGGAYGASGVPQDTLQGGVNAIVEFNVGTLALPQLEKSTVPTEFELRPLQEEAFLCQRYFIRADFPVVSDEVAIGCVNSSTTARFPFSFPQEMRTTPSITVSSKNTWNLGGISGENASSLLAGQETPYGFSFTWTDTGAWNGAPRESALLRSDTGTAYFEADAEL